MKEPNQFGRELAEALITRVQDREITAAEAAGLFAQAIIAQADEIIRSGGSREDVAEWLEAASFAYGARLEETRAYAA